MTHKEIEVAIERLERHSREDRSEDAVICRFMNRRGWLISEFRDVLVSLLRQADPDTHGELPKDRDGVPIHIGDELCGYGRPDGGVYCKATNGYMVFVGEDGECAPKEWMVWDPDSCAHYHKPTVENLLREFGTKYFPHPEMQEKILAEYAAKLREVMTDDDE